MSSPELLFLLTRWEHNITPIGVKTKVLDVIEGAYSNPASRVRAQGRGPGEKTGAFARIDFSDPVSISKEITMLDSKMYEHAKNLEFEAAANTRDRIAELKNQLLKQ